MAEALRYRSPGPSRVAALGGERGTGGPSIWTNGLALGVMPSPTRVSSALSGGTYALVVLGGLVLTAIGMGLTFPILCVSFTAGMPPAERGLTGGLFATSQQEGQASGLAALATIAAARTHTDGVSSAVASSPSSSPSGPPSWRWWSPRWDSTIGADRLEWPQRSYRSEHQPDRALPRTRTEGM